MSYKDNLTAVSSIDRKTGANGVWFTDEIIKKTSGNIDFLANELDTLDFTDIPNIAQSAQYGSIAKDIILENKFDEIEASAKSGAQASAWLSSWVDKFEGIEKSAKSGASALNALKNYDMAGLAGSAKSGKWAWDQISDKNFTDIENSAKSGASTYSTIMGMKTNLDKVTTTLINGLMNDAKSSFQAYNTINSKSATWNTLYTKVNANGSKWDSLVVNTTNWNSVYNTGTGYSGHWEVADFSKMNGCYSAVCANSAKWLEVKTSGESFNKTLTNSSHVDNWDKLNLSATNWDNAYNSIKTNSGKWNEFVTASNTASHQP